MERRLYNFQYHDHPLWGCGCTSGHLFMDKPKNSSKQGLEELGLEAIDDLSLEEQQLHAMEDIAQSLSRMADSIDRLLVQVTNIAAKLKQ
jgi:hypothetical protein